MTRPYLAQLHAAAQIAERAEAELRQYAERRLEIMSAERVRAYRRSQLVSDMIESARPIAARADCVAAQIGCVLDQAGWSESDAGYEEVREQLGRVAALVHADLHGEPGDVSSMVVAALAAFENWYRERFGTEIPAAAAPRDEHVPAAHGFLRGRPAFSNRRHNPRSLPAPSARGRAP